MYIKDYEAIENYSNEGLYRLYLMIPYGHHDRDIIIDILIERAKRAYGGANVKD